MSFRDSTWNISMSSLVILAASVFKVLCGKNRRTDKRQWKPYPRNCHQHGYISEKQMVHLRNTMIRWHSIRYEVLPARKRCTEKWGKREHMANLVSTIKWYA